jgi:SOS-response transcriptional repressor LexA
MGVWVKILLYGEMDMDDPTAEIIYDFIRAYIQEYQISPSQREIAEGCYMTHGNVARYLKKLEAQGRIKRYPHISRGIGLVNNDGNS